MTRLIGLKLINCFNSEPYFNSYMQARTYDESEMLSIWVAFIEKSIFALKQFCIK